jgi:hypothetical protein
MSAAKRICAQVEDRWRTNWPAAVAGLTMECLSGEVRFARAARVCQSWSAHSRVNLTLLDLRENTGRPSLFTLAAKLGPALGAVRDLRLAQLEDGFGELAPRFPRLERLRGIASAVQVSQFATSFHAFAALRHVDMQLSPGGFLSWPDAPRLESLALLATGPTHFSMGSAPCLSDLTIVGQSTPLNFAALPSWSPVSLLRVKVRAVDGWHDLVHGASQLLSLRVSYLATGDLQALASCTAIQLLHVYNHSLTGGEWALLAALPALTELQLRPSAVRGPYALPFISKCARLRTLRLTCNVKYDHLPTYDDSEPFSRYAGRIQPLLMFDPSGAASCALAGFPPATAGGLLHILQRVTTLETILRVDEDPDINTVHAATTRDAFFDAAACIGLP